MSVLLTGATGFVGMEVVARLLAQGDEVVCVVRGEDPAARLTAALEAVGVPADLQTGARAVPGDITRPLPAIPGVETVVHCAASVSFGLDLKTARRVNVAGTAHALAAAEHARARYVHISTAFVAGRHAGVFRENDRYVDQAFRNTYEQTKLEAELLVAGSDADTVVLRPSIVMGESTTGWTPVFNVLYWPLRAFDRGLLPAVPARPDARVDVVPVDYVADAIVHVATKRRDVMGTLHLAAGHDAPTVDDLVGLAATALCRGRPALTSLDGGLSARSPEAARYLAYFDIEAVFDTSRAQSVLGPAGIEPPPLADYFPRLVDFARRAAWGKRALRRRDAPDALTPGANP